MDTTPFWWKSRSKPKLCGVSWRAPSGRAPLGVREIYGRSDYAIIGELIEPGTRVLDLGCGRGSFSAGKAVTVRLDRERHAPQMGGYSVQADASQLPFSNASFQAIISNHSLEHVDNLTAVLDEMARVVRPGGSVSAYAWDVPGGGLPIAPIRPPRAHARRRPRSVRRPDIRAHRWAAIGRGHRPSAAPAIFGGGCRIRFCLVCA